MAFSITVPASTANLGPGFDSIGLALNRYLHLEVEQASKWSFICSSPGLENIGTDNLVTKAAAFASKQWGKVLPPCRVVMKNDIPLSKGFGSSAAAIVAGIELAASVCDQFVSKAEKARLASLWEGHPDNVAASIYGGLVIGTHSEESTEILHIEAPNIDLVALIPPKTLATKKARSVLPDMLTYKEAVQASSVANVLAAALVKQDWELVGKMMLADRFHQPYRQQLIPHLPDVCAYAQADEDAYGAALSGAGPIILCLVKEGKGEGFASRLHKQFPTCSAEVMRPAVQGSAVSIAQA
ncbi:homoserine kinase [Shouchella clausii]|uniref:homoserine kinase n=1 Tax=Shouchella clausii TaxID=79880 RepID=UPI000B968C2B|nr:homoserine kinase [Shouchella clausii]AST96861.1 homoserine kinase [Shouchella clausii]MBU8597948.1 homoserine kinase [Shouchella clausii]MCR1287195.1 homoserine kinase [Shouchella clausii]MCY1105412.1 homoserine kinase [Shouchella clausii]MEB5471658.1 homoserine kinase [Shouchella clausii]